MWSQYLLKQRGKNCFSYCTFFFEYLVNADKGREHLSRNYCRFIYRISIKHEKYRANRKYICNKKFKLTDDKIFLTPVLFINPSVEAIVELHLEIRIERGASFRCDNNRKADWVIPYRL